MFDHVVLRRAEAGTSITAGQIAEALLFYQKVHLVIDSNTLLDLLRQIGVSGLQSLLDRPDFSAVYTEEMLGTMTNSVGVSQCHDFLAIAIVGKDAEDPLNSTEGRLRQHLERSGIPEHQTKKFAVDFLRRVPVRKMSGNHFVKGGIPEAARRDLGNTEYLNSAFSEIISRLPGGYRPEAKLKVEVINGQQGFFCFDNIDYERVNRSRAQMNPALEPLTRANILTHLHVASADLALAAHYGGDFVTSAVTSSVIRLRMDMLLRRSEVNAKARHDFAEVALPDMPTVAEHVDSGARSFQEFLRLLDKSTKFRQWLNSANPDEGLTREYLHAVSSQDWIQTPKSKMVRYLISFVADKANPVAGLVAGVVDNFLIEKIFSGWRPNHFIKDQLVPFLADSKKR